MLNFFIRRAVYAVIAMWAVSVVSFIIINLPAGDYVTTYIATQRDSGNIILAEEAENLRIFYGLDRPIYVQYWKWITRILTGDLGFSFEFNLPVSEVIAQNLVPTIALALAAVIFIWVVGIPIGIYSAVKQYSPGDYIATFLGFLGLGDSRLPYRTGHSLCRLRSDSSVACRALLAGVRIRTLVFRETARPAEAHDRANHNSWHGRNCDADPYHASELARRVKETLCDNCTRQGAERMAHDNEVSSSHGTQPGNQFDRIHPSVPDLQ